ncbi:hypothetical protein HX005_05725 [Acinetobacter sp. R933-2]|uniref:ABZJ_00895 family protein n=1 Tax=Acinetobacter sp. R933-2 TaxID=2746728 RepID=UPI002577DDE1|nr:ABZJ_00895 family protein [Acinetobacter sp. R933-2]MDM1246891.1 hypothetical protein [Acinetobacter sp. R933-2]
MTSLSKYFLWFFVLCLMLTMVVGVLVALLPSQVAGVLTALPYLISMIIVLHLFLKQQKRAPSKAEQKKFSIGFSLIFWTYNFIGIFIGVMIFARHDAEVWNNFLLYMQSPQFLMISAMMLLMLAIPLFLITYWFYGKQAQRMAAKMFS